MGLAVVVGLLGELLEEDPEGAKEFRKDLNTVNVVLNEHGLPSHTEPEHLAPIETRAPVDSFPYSFLHYLRRAYAYAVESPGVTPPKLSDGDDPGDDPINDRVASERHHLLWHSDAEGFYVPIEFDHAIEHDDVPGGFLGSSQKLLAELVVVAPTIGIMLEGANLTDAEVARLTEVIESEGNYFIEIIVWLALYEAARTSVERKTVITFC